MGTGWRAVPVALVLMTGACGGGGDSGGSSGGVPVVAAPAPSPSPSVAITLATDRFELTGTDDASDASFTIEATQTGTSTGTIVPDIQFDRTQLTIPAGIETAAGKYTVRARTAKGLGVGTHRGQVTMRLCRDAGCADVYPGTTHTATYTLTVGMRDWTGLQRNPAHDGHVHATYDPAAFRRIWVWKPDGYTVTGVASVGDTVYTTVRNQDGTISVHAISGDAGSQRWLYNMGRLSSSSAPATGNGRVYVATMTTSSSDNPIMALDAATGEFRPPVMPFASQWADFQPPTIYKEWAYAAAGYYGNVVYGFDERNRVMWNNDGTGYMWDGQTPAVDEDYVYYYAGKALDIFDRRTGERLRSLTDPTFQQNFYDYFGAPILGSLGNVLAYSGNRNDGTPSPLLTWSLSSGGVAWRSADIYSTIPAVGDGMVYLARNQPARLDALREASGATAWSWTPPSGERFIGNTIITDTLVFVSTDKAVYAIATTDPAHPVRWTAPTPGEMAITATGRLVIAQRMDLNGYPGLRQLVAYTLK